MIAEIWTKNPARSGEARLLDKIQRSDPRQLGEDLFDRLAQCLKWRDRLFVRYLDAETLEIVHTEYERR